MQKKQNNESEEAFNQAASTPSSSSQIQATNQTNQTFVSDRNPSSTTSTANTTKMTVKLKCPLCQKPLDGSFRTITHAICGLRFCGTHLAQLAQTTSQCPRCDRQIMKEDLMNIPSLSSSQRATHESTKNTGSTSEHRMKLMSTQAGELVSGTQTNNSTAVFLYECPICNLASLSHAKLLEHSKIHANIAGKCPICAIKYGRDYFSKHLYGHLMLRHKEQKTAHVSTSKRIADTVDQLPANTGLGVKQNSTRYSMQNQIQLQASKGAQTTTMKKPTSVQLQAQRTGSQKPSSIQTKQTINPATMIHDTTNVQHNLPKQSVLSNMMLLQTQNYNSSNHVLQLAKKKSKESRGQSLTSALSQGQLISKQTASGVQNPAAKPARAVPRPAQQMNQEKKTPISRDERGLKMKKLSNEGLPFETNKHLTQGLLGVYTFSIVNGDDESKRKLELTSRYTSANHKVSLLKRQSPVQIEPFKLTNLEKFLREQEPVQKLGSEDSCHTDDGISSTSSQQQNEDSQCLSPRTNGKQSTKNINSKGKTEDFFLDDQQEVHEDTSKKDRPKLRPPLYLEEIQRICFPFEKLPQKKVILQKETTNSSLNKIVLSNSSAKVQRQSQAEKFGAVSPEMPPRTLAQSPHQHYYYSSSNKKFSFSPTNQNHRSSVKVKQPMQQSVTPNQSDKETTNKQDFIRQKNVTKFNPNPNIPPITLFQTGGSPKGHHGTNPIPELNFREFKLCTFEEIEKFHKLVFYSTRTSDDKLHFLSILVCAQPILKEEVKNGDRQDLSDAIFSDEDEEDSNRGTRASLEPFVLVIVTSKPLFDSVFGSQMLELIYQHCFHPLYRRICFPSPMLANYISGHCLSKKSQEYMPLETAISLLFDLMNIFFACKEDSYRQLKWKNPLASKANESQNLLQVNQIFLGSASNFLLNCNLSFRKLLELVQVNDIIKLYSCMLLEKKIVLVGNDSTFQQQLAPLIEALLSLLSPLDSQVFSNVSYCLSEEMVFYMEKPGSIIMGMPQKIWTSHGKKVFEKSFDTYIVVFEIEAQLFHLKTENDAIGLPRTFSKLLRRSIAAIDTKQSEIYASFQLKQAFFNVLLLLISGVKSQEARQAEKKFKAQTLNSFGGKQGQGVLSDNSSNSLQSKRGEKNQYPSNKEFLRELKQTTTFIDLSDKLEKKESSVSFIAECLEIIEKQKIDWFLQLLEHQVQKVGPDLMHLAKLFCPQQAYTTPVDSLKEFELGEIIRVCNENSPDQKQKSYASFDEQFRVKKRLVSKTLRTNLLKLNCKDRGQRFISENEYGNSINSASQNRDGREQTTLRSLAPIDTSRSNFPVKNQVNYSSKQKSSELSGETPLLSFPSTRKGLKDVRTPQTPDGLAVRAFVFGDGFEVEPLSSSRAPRYSSTHKPHIEFKQVRSSQSPGSKKKEQSPKAVGITEESKEGKLPEPQPKPQAGGFFSMITNFFSSNKVKVENTPVIEAKTSAIKAKEEQKEFQARKASKSMQVVQPQFMNFQRPIDMHEVAKIKTLSSGLAILKNLQSSQGESTQLNLGFQSIQPSRYSQSLINNEAAQNSFYIHAQNEKNTDKQHEQAHIRQETATFIKNASLMQSASKPQETAQFAYTPLKFKDHFQNSTQRVILNDADLFFDNGEEQPRLQTFNSLQDADECNLTNRNELQIEFQNALNSIVQRQVISRTSPQKSIVSEIAVANANQFSRNLQGIKLNSIDCSGPDMQTFAQDEGLHIVVPKNSAAITKENEVQSMATKYQVLLRQHQSMKNKPLQLSQNDLNDRVFLSARGFHEGEIRRVSPTPQVSLTNTLQRGNEEKMLKANNQKIQNRPSFPFTNECSPNSSAAMFWSAPHEVPPAEKRFSLNAIRIVQNQSSSKGSANVASSKNRFSEVGGQYQKSISAISSKSGQEIVSNNGNITLVRTATINLDQDLLAASKAESSVITDPQSDFVQVTKKSATFSSSQSDILQMKFGKIQSAKDSNTQKLKITISKLQSKQTAVQLRQDGNSTTPHKSLSQAGSNQGVSSQVACQIHHSQSALSFQKLQKQGRNTKQFISPKIVTKLGPVAYQSGIVTGTNTSSSKPILSLYRYNGSSSVVDSGKATQKIQLQKHLSQSSQNLKGTQQLKRAALLSNDVVVQNSTKRDIEKAQDVFTASHRESLTKKGQFTQQYVLQRFICADQDGHSQARNKQIEGVLEASEGHLYSPRKSQSPRQQIFKQRTKAYSQISHAAALPQTSQTYFPSKQVSQTQISSGNLGFKNKFQHDNNRNQTIYLQPIGSLSQPGTTLLHSQSVQLAQTGPYNENNGSLLKGSNQKEVLHNILKKGMQRQVASNITQSAQPGTSLVEKSRSSNKFMSVATLSKHNSDKSKSATLTLSRSQFREKHFAEGKRNSMIELPDSDDKQLIAQLPGPSKQPNSKVQQVDLTTSLECHTPSDICLDTIIPRNSRRQQRLTQVAEEKKGDDEHVEMENLQEMLDGYESNRIRSISHQFPSQASFLRASQDKMQIGMPLTEQQQRIEKKDDDNDFANSTLGIKKLLRNE